MYRFGGTDGAYHYNDTWSFDLVTSTWTELSCIGYIPTPREGHAGAVVDGVMYVFGGRDVNGKDLGDLAAFRISSASGPHGPVLGLLTVQTNGGTCSKTWVLRRRHGVVTPWLLPTARSSSLAEKAMR